MDDLSALASVGIEGYPNLSPVLVPRILGGLFIDHDSTSS